jgi:predicted nuclease of predicted toxin-antitoxin system
MLRFLCDENFNGHLLRALLQRMPTLEVVRVQDVGLQGQDDPVVLAWAAANGRMLLTHDNSTMTDHVRVRLESGATVPGVFIVDLRATFAEVIESVMILNECSEQVEWQGRVEHLPLS